MHDFIPGPDDQFDHFINATETKMPHRNDFAAAELGHTAYYAARWVNTKGVAGPWSEITGHLVN